MPPQTIKNTVELSNAIKARREEVGLTVAKAALAAGVTSKTWARYETGADIRSDKVVGLCKALKWKSLPCAPAVPDDEGDALHKIGPGDPYWSDFLASEFCNRVAVSFAAGAALLLDDLDESLEALSSSPRGTHLGQAQTLLSSWLPPQFLTRYDYEFVYAMLLETKALITRLCRPFPLKSGDETEESSAYYVTFLPNSVIEEIILLLIFEESEYYLERCRVCDLCDPGEEPPSICEEPDSWVHDLCEDMDVETWLYGDIPVPQGDDYHFDNWFTRQFWGQ